MNATETSQPGYAFSLPLLLARLRGRKARRAEWSRWEAYGFGTLVFAMSCIFAGRILLPLVRPGLGQALLLLLLPFATCLAFLPLYSLNARAVALLRRLRFYTAPTNNSFQHVVIMTLTSAIAFFFSRDDCAWLNSLGVFWFGLLFCNLLAALLLKLRHDA